MRKVAGNEEGFSCNLQANAFSFYMLVIIKLFTERLQSCRHSGICATMAAFFLAIISKSDTIPTTITVSRESAGGARPLFGR
jgi:hypothetical protein